MIKQLLSLLFVLLLCFPTVFSQNPERINSGVLIDTAIALHDRGEYKKAIELYRKINRNDTNYVRALYELGLSYTADTQYNKAVEVFEAGLHAEEDREREPDIYNAYGSLLDDMEQPAKAIEILDAGIAKYPAYSSLYLNKAITLLKINKVDEAEELFKKILLMDPYSHSSHYLLGQIALQKGQIIQAFISSFSYLMMNPSGRYYQKSISTLSLIASYKEELKKTIENRKESPNENFQALEDLLLSKIALDKNYKPLVKIDDPISRQIQALLEKLEYVEGDNDFWMQYYVPLFKSIFSSKQFEPFINHIFSAVDIEIIKEYNKKNKKENEALISSIVGYLNDIRTTRTLNFTQRQKPAVIYNFIEGKLSGFGPVSEDGKKAVGDWTHYYKYGNIKSKGSYDNNGEKTGKWSYYSFDQKLTAIENLKAGKLEGEGVYYFINGNLSSSNNYKNDQLDGTKTTYFLPGSLRTIEKYKNGLLEGEKKIYYPSGMLHYIETYRSDTLHGLYQSYYETGQLEYSTEYTSGKLEGRIKGYHDNGQPSFEGQYSNNELTGEWKRYFKNGALKSIEHYIKGSLEGEFTELHKNGKEHFKANYKKGKAFGDISYFDDDGLIYSKLTFKNDLLTEAYYYDKSGKETGHSMAKNKKIDLTVFTSDGVKSSEISYDEKGLPQGDSKKYFPSGKIKSIDQYEAGELTGVSTEFYANGRKKTEVELRNNQKEGRMTSFYSNGQVKSQGWYTAGEAEGDWLFFNLPGQRVVENFYREDELHKFRVEFWPDGRLMSQTENQFGWIKKHTQYDSSGKIIAFNDLSKGTGAFIEKHMNGKTLASGQYLNGAIHGPYTFYFFDGSVQTTSFYNHGFVDSVYKSYHFGGNIATEGRYKMGKKSGEWKFYYRSGKIRIVERYVDGELNGKTVSYFENGQIDTETSYENDELNGTKLRYDQSGELIYVFYYKNDNLVGYSYNDKSGKLVPMIPVVNGTGSFKTYYKNGNLSASIGYADGFLHGKTQIYHPNGKLSVESIEDFGFTKGINKEYHANGQLSNSVVYLDNNLHGPFVVYNEKGQKTREGNYHNDELHGSELLYDETTGKLKETRIYFFGTLISVKK